MRDEIHALLTALGATADDVAATLGGAGVRARRGDTAFDNPIVRYPFRHLNVGGRIEIPVGGAVLTVVREGTWLATPLPAPVRDFLDRFHAGAYPQLELT